MKKIFILLLLNLVFLTASGQIENPRMVNRNSISIYGMGPAVLGSVSYDYFITPNVNIGGGVGFIGIHAGANFHLWGAGTGNRWTPYLGAAVVRSLFPAVGVDYLPYFPLGMHFAGANRFNFAIEIAPFQLKMLAWNVAGIKFGYRF